MRHLKPSQVLARGWFRAYRPAPDLRAAPPLRAPAAAWKAPPPKAPRLLSHNHARFLNVEHDIGAASAWNDASRSKLWLYNLHYFDDLARPDCEAWRERHFTLMKRWVAENPPASGTGWEPYPLSVRIGNWIKWHLRTGALDEALRHSLAVQTRYLSRRFEWHLRGNHLLANAKALVLSSMFFEGSEAAGWRGLGMRVLGQQLGEQVLDDGGHFELSPMYHAIVLEDALDFLNAAVLYRGALEPAQAEVVARWRDAVPRMLAWLAAMTHPDGEIGYFNDGAPGVAPSLNALLEYAGRLGISAPPALRGEVVALESSGYLRLTRHTGVLLGDVGSVGPDYNPGHAHADTLSFELSIDGQRVVVNSGTSQYGAGPERNAERGTAAHSTVEIDGQDSSEVWAEFRVARRARPFDLTVSPEGSGLRVSCAHDGYRRLFGRPVHRRAWHLGPDSLLVEDRIEGSFRSAIARFHLHPDVVTTTVEGSAGTLRLPAGRVARWEAAGGAVRLENSFYCPEFGRRIPSRCLALHLSGTECRMLLKW